VVQDSLVKAWKTRWRVRDPENFPPGWQPLRDTGHMTFLRKRRPFSYPCEGIGENEPIDTTAVDQELHSALATLPDFIDAALTLRYFEEMDYRSIENMLGVSNALCAEFSAAVWLACGNKLSSCSRFKD